MDHVGNTLVAPVWINNGKVYVATVDIPRGEWNLVLHLTPIQNSLLVFDTGYKIASVNPWIQEENDLLVWTASRSINFGMGWQIFFQNNQPPGSKTPVAYSYNINLAPLKSSDAGRHHYCHRTYRSPGESEGILSYDPVVVAQPDPIYP